MIKNFLRRLTPPVLLRGYHYLLGRFSALAYGFPSQELVVIGVTGTKGKSTTVQFIGRLLESAGERVGWTSTIGFKIGAREWVNNKKMTMLGRGETQKLLRAMVRATCRYAIIETSSQGIEQFRHSGINYDILVFTNLTPEHLEAHGGFENYKRAKGRLFSQVARSRRKGGRPKVAVLNFDDPYAPYFASFALDKITGWTTRELARPDVLCATDIKLTARGSQFFVNGLLFHLRPSGLFNVYNALAAISVLRVLGYDWPIIQKGVAQLKDVPGRLEIIDAGQPFTVIVDYAYEPAALAAAYAAIKLWPFHRLIHVVGSAGGGRDVARRATLGQMAAARADIVFVTNEDPYDDDPLEIINDVANAAVSYGKRDEISLFRVVDRATAIQRAVTMAEAGDLVLITGKGCEPVMAVAHGKKIPWDDRLAARQALEEYVRRKNNPTQSG